MFHPERNRFGSDNVLDQLTGGQAGRELWNADFGLRIGKRGGVFQSVLLSIRRPQSEIVLAQHAQVALADNLPTAIGLLPDDLLEHFAGVGLCSGAATVRLAKAHRGVKAVR